METSIWRALFYLVGIMAFAALNAAYLVWALESLPDSWLENHELTGIHLHFKKETHAGESMKSLLFRQDSLTSHHIMHGDELRAEAVLEWKAAAIA